MRLTVTNLLGKFYLWQTITKRIERRNDSTTTEKPQPTMTYGDVPGTIDIWFETQESVIEADINQENVYHILILALATYNINILVLLLRCEQ